MKSKGEKRTKKIYSTPRLVAYGDFRTLTRVSAKGGTSNDGGGKPRTKLSGGGG